MAGFDGECFIGNGGPPLEDLIYRKNLCDCLHPDPTDESLRHLYTLQKDPPVRCVHQDSVAMSLL